jgi:large subunit ribosomal protein L25
MARAESTVLNVEPREPEGSRAVRRLRRAGNIPGVVYGGGDDPVSFQVSTRVLRHALAGAGAVLDLRIEGGATGPVVVKELVVHPVSGLTMHLDLLRVRLDRPIQSTVLLELTGGEDSPGVKDGGVLESVTRELNIEALPNDIPDSLSHDVSGMQIGDTLTLESLRPPSTVTLLDDAETVIATLTPPRLQVESDEEIESETEVVGEGEGGETPEDDGEGDAGGEAAGDSDAAE